MNLRKDHYHTFSRRRVVTGTAKALLFSCPRNKLWSLVLRHCGCIFAPWEWDCSREREKRWNLFPSNPMWKHFQQWMSWFPQRWRTQWNAIRHANRRIQWVIKILNAACTSSEVCLLECLSFKLLYTPNVYDEPTDFNEKGYYRNKFHHDFNENVCRWKRRLSSISDGERDVINCMWTSRRMGLIKRQSFGPLIRQDYPLNLSILLGGGKETNKDSLSNGEWSGKCSDWKSSEL